MKIIQIFVVPVVPYDYSKHIYGLGDDGLPYVWNAQTNEWDNE